MGTRIENLIQYCQGIYNKEDGKVLYEKYLTDIKTVTPEEVIQIENEQLKMGMTPKDMLTVVDKLMNVFYESLSAYQLYVKVPLFLQNMIDENKALTSILDEFKEVMKNPTEMTSTQVREFLYKLKGYNNHMEKVENIIFSSLEKLDDHFDGLKIMWSLHDEIRNTIKFLIKESENQKPIDLIVGLGKLYFLLYGVVQKQNLILFPVVINKLDDHTFEDMFDASFEYGFSYIQEPERIDRGDSLNMDQLNNILKTETGHLEIETLVSILNVLPIDFTFVNADDEVQFFNDNPDRVFPRSKSVIGRNVRNCHPPESVDVVEKILQSFREGKRDKAEFWIKLRGKMVYIYYLPISDKAGVYKGCLEISQEISGLRALEGEQRLLDWK